MEIKTDVVTGLSFDEFKGKALVQTFGKQSGINSYHNLLFDFKTGLGYKYMLTMQKGTTKKELLEMAYEWIVKGNTDNLNYAPVYTWRYADNDNARFKVPIQLAYYR